MSATTRRTMVFGDDGSPSADLAWLWVNNHSWPDWRVAIVSAVMPKAGPPPPTALSELHEWNPDNPRRAFADSCFASVTQLTCEKDPRLALSGDADLLVIGQRGPGVAKALHLGSTAEWLMLHPPAPMVIPRHGHRTETVILCHDGSASAWAATTAMCHLPWVAQLSIMIVGVHDGRADVDHAVEAAATTLSDAGADVKQCLLDGHPTKALLDFTERTPFDLLAMGTRGLTGLRRLRLGSTASALAHSVPSSIMLACVDDKQVGANHA